MSPAASVLSEVRDLIAAEPASSAAAHHGGGDLGQLCRAAARSLSGSGAGITVMVGHDVGAVIAASDAASASIENLQFTAGEGPCLDAHASHRPVLINDVTQEGMARWAGYGPAVLEHGVRAVFAFPLQLGASGLGVMDVYRTRSGPMGSPAMRLALGFADVAFQTLVDAQTQVGPDQIPGTVDYALGQRLEVYQAQGMVAAQLLVSATEALARLRAYAFVENKSLDEVARAVLDRRLILERDT